MKHSEKKDNFWTRCVQSLDVHCHGHIIEFYFKKHRQRHGHGMQKKHRSKPGWFGHCNGIFLHSIITECLCLKIQNLSKI